MEWITTTGHPFENKHFLFHQMLQAHSTYLKVTNGLVRDGNGVAVNFE